MAFAAELDLKQVHNPTNPLGRVPVTDLMAFPPGSLNVDLRLDFVIWDDGLRFSDTSLIYRNRPGGRE